MNRELHGRMGVAAAIAAAWTVPATARDAPSPSLSLDPIVARHLLAPVDAAGIETPGYRLELNSEHASGQRAKLSIEVGDSTLFAITGKLARRPVPSGPLDPGQAKALGHRRDGGKVYGAGVSRNVQGINLSATYQYSRISAEQRDDREFGGDGPGKSHSLRATARVRFSP